MKLWWATLVATYRAFAADDCMLLAAGLAYYSFMSIFPLCLLSIAVLGFVWRGHGSVETTLQFASDWLPPRGLDVVHATISTVVEDRARLGVIGLLSLMWLGRQLFEGLEISLSRLWRITDRRPFWRRLAISLSMVLIGASLVLAEVIASGVLSWAQTRTAALHLPEAWTSNVVLFWQSVHAWVVVPLTVFVITLTLYHRLPRISLSWGQCLPGALFCTCVWKLASVIYFDYLSVLTQSSPVYGSIWGAVGLLIWFFLCSVVFLFGAELIRVRQGQGVAA